MHVCMYVLLLIIRNASCPSLTPAEIRDENMRNIIRQIMKYHGGELWLLEIQVASVVSSSSIPPREMTEISDLVNDPVSDPVSDSVFLQ